MVLFDPTAPAAPRTIALLSAVPKRTWLAVGFVTGPLYIGVSMAQARTRDGFVRTKHPWSGLANGALRSV